MIDVIVPWPASCDYPLWRAFLNEERARFSQVTVAFTPPSAEVDYRPFVAEPLQQLDVRVLDVVDEIPYPQDWRDYATNMALLDRTAEWVWFTEQDFFIRSPFFWNKISFAMKISLYDAISHEEHSEGRFHPSCLFVRRDLLEGMNLREALYFGPEPVDHFWKFSQRLKAYFVADLDRELRLRRGLDWDHPAGLSYNHQLLEQGRPITFKPDEFRRYLLQCLSCGVALEPGWQQRVTEYLSKTEENPCRSV